MVFRSLILFSLSTSQWVDTRIYPYGFFILYLWVRHAVPLRFVLWFHFHPIRDRTSNGVHLSLILHYSFFICFPVLCGYIPDNKISNMVIVRTRRFLTSEISTDSIFLKNLIAFKDSKIACFRSSEFSRSRFSNFSHI